MLARGSYQINSREEGKVFQRDESYKSCILAMLIFLLLCIVLILASWPWRKADTYNYNKEEDSAQTAGIRGEQSATDSNREDIEESNEQERPEKNDQAFERYSNNKSAEESGMHLTTSNTESPSNDRKIQSELSTTENFAVTNAGTTEILLNEISKSEIEEVRSSIFSTLDTQTEQSTIREIEESSVATDYSTNLLAGLEESTGRIQTTQQPVPGYTSLKRLVVSKYFGNESTTLINQDNGDNWLNEMDVETTSQLGDLSKNTESTTKFLPSSEKWIYTPTLLNTERTTNFAAREEKIEITTVSPIHQKTNQSPLIVQNHKVNICESGSCKQLASKILSYMNHSADPCDDFYEYACGGLEADPQINQKDLSLKAYEKIGVEAQKKEGSEEYPEFSQYYKSCLNYESTVHISQRLQLAKKALSNIGTFYTGATWRHEFQGFTTLFTNLLMNNRPLLFDILPDLNETSANGFTLKIGLAISTSPFRCAHSDSMCAYEDNDILQDHVDLDRLYDKYQNCRNDTRAMIVSITETLSNLDIFGNLDHIYNVSQYIDELVVDIDREIFKGILAFYPPESEIREFYRSKHYTVTTLGELEAQCKLLNWTELIYSLTRVKLAPHTQIQIYYKNLLFATMQKLENFGRRFPIALNNALMALYAQNLYKDLVVPESTSDSKRRCLCIASNLLQREASWLYMSSFTEHELGYMETIMQTIFYELTETLKLEIEGSEWAVEWGRQVLLKKLRDIKISFPKRSYFKKNNGFQLNITDNYFVHSLILMKKYRFMMYSVLQENPNDPQQIWTFSATPFQSSPKTIYGLNTIVVPIAAIDWPTALGIGKRLNYLTLATIGNQIAREIAHNFDTNGIRYWNGSRDSEFALMTDSDLTKTTFEEYINCQRYSLYQEPVDMVLPRTGQRVSFKVPLFTLNERLSDAVGMRLAHDTLARLGSTASEKRLPWLDLDVSQNFYLAYAQTHCTKAPLTSSYVSLHEEPSLPSRIRIFVAASNNKLLGEAWNCPEGSQMLPTFSCNVFPHLEYHATAPDSA